jgi:hypothetical protein
MTTLAEAQAKLAEYQAAETEALAAQEIRLTSAGGVDRAEMMADLRTIQRGVREWRGIVARLQAQANGQPTFGGMTFTSGRFGDYTSNGR